MELDLNLVASFLVLASERHYGNAAAALYVTSSALSRQIQRLERQLDVVLIERGPAGVFELTSAGRRFADDALPLLVLARTTYERARSPALTDVLRIGFPAGNRRLLDQFGLAGVSGRLADQYPDLHLEVLGVPPAQLGRCLVDDRADVVVTGTPARTPAVDSVVAAVRHDSGFWHVECRHADRRAAVRAVVHALAATRRPTPASPASRQEAILRRRAVG